MQPAGAATVRYRDVRPYGGMVSDLVIGTDGLARPRWAAGDELLRTYYDTEWGIPVHDERGVYERICLEVFQCGLSWAVILRRRAALRRAFAGFNPDHVAGFGVDQVERLLADPTIIRNRAKIEATIHNAAATIRLRDHGGLAGLVWSYQPTQTPAPSSLAEIPTRSPESQALAKRLQREGFRFVGPTTMYALMEAIGIVDTHLLGSHRRGSSGVW